jgi:hypothetical protein
MDATNLMMIMLIIIIMTMMMIIIIIIEPKQMLDWLITGLTYLLPKSGDTKEPKNYRPITCLSTMYKTLTGITARRISVHLEEHNLLPAEQKRISLLK